ncbi:MAG TPA: glycosyltransferase family 39 protein [Chitinophagaceae bacterium]|nr:glycosyltransferase family 39 protein [Chitinophagaceae bacterium]
MSKPTELIPALPGKPGAWITRHHRVLFFGGWLLLALLQARYTELLDDEAYYWVYSRFPAWGYFDHPPMIALMIRAGYFFFHNELGVRLGAALLNLGTLLILEHLTGKARPFLFYGIAASLAVLQLAGIFAVPDSPLIFFTACFFWAYRRFDQQADWPALLALCLASLCLLYSKYHGVLVIFFTLLSNLRLLRDYRIYLAGLLVLAGLAPHLYWQYLHGWPSLQYHLVERNASIYQFSFTTEYILGQLLIAGPLAGGLLIPAALLQKPADPTQRAMYWTLTGIYLFFLAATLRGRVEPNWTAPLVVPLVVLSYDFLQSRRNWRRILYPLLAATLVLTLAARILMVADLVPLPFIRERFHSWKQEGPALLGASRGLPVVFEDSYQQASRYWFYTGIPGYGITGYRERRTNFDFWPVEDSLLGRPVCLMTRGAHAGFSDSVETLLGEVWYRYDTSFASFARVRLACQPRRLVVRAGDTTGLVLQATLPQAHAAFLQSHPTRMPVLRAGLFGKSGWIKDLGYPGTLSWQGEPVHWSFKPDLVPGHYFLVLALAGDDGLVTHNSLRIPLEVTP